MDLSNGGLLQVHGFRHADVVELAQLMAQHRIEFGLTILALDQVLVAHALAASELDRQPQQRRGDAFRRRVLEVMPAQERHDQAQVTEAVFGPVAARLLNQAIKCDRQIGLVIESRLRK